MSKAPETALQKLRDRQKQELKKLPPKSPKRDKLKSTFQRQIEKLKSDINLVKAAERAKPKNKRNLQHINHLEPSTIERRARTIREKGAKIKPPRPKREPYKALYSKRAKMLYGVVFEKMTRYSAESLKRFDEHVQKVLLSDKDYKDYDVRLGAEIKAPGKETKTGRVFKASIEFLPTLRTTSREWLEDLSLQSLNRIMKTPLSASDIYKITIILD